MLVPLEHWLGVRATNPSGMGILPGGLSEWQVVFYDFE